jgi:hypothetical protein
MASIMASVMASIMSSVMSVIPAAIMSPVVPAIPAPATGHIYRATAVIKASGGHRTHFATLGERGRRDGREREEGAQGESERRVHTEPNPFGNLHGQGRVR